MRYSFDAASIPTAKKAQFYSMLGTRGIWHDGWKAVTTHPSVSGWSHFEQDTWELYHTQVDRSELHDLAGEQHNRLHYVYNFVGITEQHVVATEDVPTGENLILSASFDKAGEDPPGVATGTLSLYHGDKKVGEGDIKTRPGKFSIAGEGLNVGCDRGEPITDDYPGPQPWAFTGGTVRRVAIDVSGDAYVDLEREAVAMLSRE